MTLQDLERQDAEHRVRVLLAALADEERGLRLRTEMSAFVGPHWERNIGRLRAQLQSARAKLEALTPA